jgi:HAD superfamily hydrolase (TIGR01549 family)
MASAVTFDAGMTLIELDLDFLSARLRERGLAVSVSALREGVPASWRRYDELVEVHTGHPWRAMMARLLEVAGVERELEPTVEWLWAEQPRHNLWRKPIPEMVALARELTGRGVKVAVLSNSEGKLAELLAEIGIADAFAAIIDSGRVGIEKPDARIFAHTLDAIGATEAVHIGDSWTADIEGALHAGWRAVWYRSRPAAGSFTDPRVAVAHDASEVRAALAAFGI